MTRSGRDEVLVLKFGGTSVATPKRIRRAAARIRAHVRRGRSVAVVVSAAGHETDLLLARIGAVAGADATGYDDPAVRREVDRVLATGEDRSAGVLALALHALGIPALSMRGGEAGIMAAGDFGAGVIERVYSDNVRHLMERGVVPVISGFQGERADGETVTLGRGGSDTSAVALAAALGARACHIVTDVDGVYDRDPHRYPDARPFETLDFAELIAITEAGAQIVHPRAARLAAAHQLPLRVYDFRAPLSGGGTLITATTADTHDRATTGHREQPDVPLVMEVA